LTFFYDSGLIWFSISPFLIFGKARERCHALDLALPIPARRLWLAHVSVLILLGLAFLAMMQRAPWLLFWIFRPQYMKSLVIIPMQEELDAFRRFLDAQRLEGIQRQVGRLAAIHFPGPDITLVKGGLGKVQFAIHTQHVLDMTHGWDLVICAGAAGALVETLKVGDVVVATETVEHDIHNRFGRPIIPRFAGAAELIGSLRSEERDHAGFAVHFGPLASGDEDVVTAGRRGELRRRTQALAVAWEGAGAARACHFHRVPFLEIRGITDGADTKAAADFSANLETAMKHVATLIVGSIQSRAAVRS
jgi:adenosylhomocysteine nucleosidase